MPCAPGRSSPTCGSTRRRSSGPDVPDMSGRGIAVNEEQVRAVVPAGRRGTVEDIASAVCYLASDEAGVHHGARHGRRWRLARQVTPRLLRWRGAPIRAHLLRWRPRLDAQRTGSTPRARPSGAASQLDPSRRPAGGAGGASAGGVNAAAGLLRRLRRRRLLDGRLLASGPPASRGGWEPHRVVFPRRGPPGVVFFAFLSLRRPS